MSIFAIKIGNLFSFFNVWQKKEVKTIMKKVLQVASLLLLLTMGFSACDLGGNGDKADGSKETEIESESESENKTGDDDMNKLILISGGKSDYKVIRPKASNISTITVMQNFYIDVNNKTGFNLKSVAYDDTEKMTDRELLIGNTNRPESTDASHEVSFSGCRVEVVGNKVVVSGYSDELINRALKNLMAALKEDEDGNWYIKRDFIYEYDLSGVNIAPPKYETASGELEEVYACGADNYEMSISGTTETEYKQYLNLLRSKGFSLYDDNKIGNNLFATYTAKKNGVETAVFTMFYPDTKVAKVIYGVKGYLMGTEEIAYPEDPVVTPSITQLGRDMVYNGWKEASQTVGGAPGMCYIIQLADGRYIIFDGGPADDEIQTLSKNNGRWTANEARMTEDAKKLYDLLVAKNPDKDEKPVIAAWYFTHGHGDHTGLAIDFLKTYKDRVTVQTVGYNIPTSSVGTSTDIGVAWSAGSLTGAVNGFPAKERPKVVTPHSGQEFYFPGCEIEVLYTYEDYRPHVFNNGNQTSIVYRVKMKSANGDETVFMVMGDAEKENCEEIKKRYAGELDCDILQLTHHGFNGACDGLYNLMTPEISFWACDPYRYETDGRCLGTDAHYEFNIWIRANCQHHYTSEYTTTIEILPNGTLNTIK